METIYLPIDMDQKDSAEAKRLFIHTIEQINQNNISLTKLHEDKLGFLVRSFNSGNLNVTNLKKALIFVINESINHKIN